MERIYNKTMGGFEYMIDYDLRKNLDRYVDRLKISTNRNHRILVRTELVDYLERVEEDGSIRAECLVYVFERSL